MDKQTVNMRNIYEIEKKFLATDPNYADEDISLFYNEKGKYIQYTDHKRECGLTIKFDVENCKETVYYREPHQDPKNGWGLPIMTIEENGRYGNASKLFLDNNYIDIHLTYLAQRYQFCRDELGIDFKPKKEEKAPVIEF